MQRTPLTILACQVAVPDTPDAAARDEHVRQMCAAIDERLTARPADVVVLPELCTISYDRATFEQLDVLAEGLEGPSVAAFAALATTHSTRVVFGMPTYGERAYRITQVVVGPDGAVVGTYDKLHAAHYGFSMEKDFFETGGRLLTFDVGGIRLAPIVCYDIRFPELSRTLAVDHGVDVLLHCSAFGRDESFDSWHPFVTARAMENQLYVLGLSRAGETWGGSLLCGPWVDADHPPIRLPEHDEAFVHLTIDPDEIARVRSGYTFLADRLDRYDALPVSGADPGHQSVPK